jgi:uncharacterized protein YfaS (alpha-2-macroglobulin family)
MTQVRNLPGYKPFGLLLALLSLVWLIGAGSFVVGCTEEKAASDRTTDKTSGVPVPSAKVETSQNQGAPIPANQEELQVLQFLPQGKVKTLSQLVVMFNQPMVALGDYSHVPDGLIGLEPKLPGELRWLNQYCLAYVLDRSYQGSLELTAKLALGIQSLSGKTLEKEYQTSLSLPKIAVLNSYLAPDPDFKEALKPRWEIEFNQKLDLDSLNSHSFFSYQDQSGQEIKIPAKWEVQKDLNPDQNSKNKTAYVLPEKYLPPDTEYVVYADSGLVSLDGPLPSSESINILKSKTYGPTIAKFRYSDDGLAPYFLENPERSYNYLLIDFSNFIKMPEALEFISSEPPIPSLDSLKSRYKKQKESKEKLRGQRDQYGQAQEQEDTEAAEGLSQEDSALGFEEDELPEFYSAIYLHGPFKSLTNYTLTFKKGLPDTYGQTTLEDQTLSFNTGAYTPSATFLDPGGLIEPTSQPLVPIKILNLAKVTVRGYALDEEEAARLLSITKTEPTYNLNQWTLDNKSAQLSGFFKSLGKSYALDLIPPGQATDGPVTMALDLAKLFGQDRFGKILVLTFDGSFERQMAIFQISDIGLTLKLARDDSLVWTTSLDSGKSLPGAKLSILDNRGHVRWQGESDEHGLAHLPKGQELLDLTKGQENDSTERPISLFVAASSGQSLSIWAPEWNGHFLDYSFYSSFSSPLYDSRDYNWLLTSQPIYKPGETVQLKVISRTSNGDDLADLPAGTARLVIKDPQDNLVLDTQVRVSPYGTANLDYPLPEDVPLGEYAVFLVKDSAAQIDYSWLNSWSQDKKFSYLGHFNVQIYRAPAFKLEFADMPKEAFPGQTLNISSKAIYHFGSPVTGQKAEWNFSAENYYSFSLDSLPGFKLVNTVNPGLLDSDIDGVYPERQALSSGEGLLDQDGAIQTPFTLEAPKTPLPRMISLSLVASDVDQRPVFNQTSFLAHPSSLYVGLKSNSFMVKSGEKASFSLAAATADGQIAAGHPVELTLYRRHWTTVRRRSPGAIYEYDSKVQDQKIESLTLATESQPINFQFQIPRAGFFWVRAVIKDNNGFPNESSESLYATGTDAAGWQPQESNDLVLIPDKTEYAPGDTARILIQSPFSEGQGLMTVERAGVRSSRLFELGDTSPIIEVPIGEDDSPNLYVAVMLTRGRIDLKPENGYVDLGKPTYRRGYLNLSIPSSNNRLDVKVKASESQYKPGQEAQVDVSVSYQGQPFSDGELALAVVDASVIQVGGNEMFFPNTLYDQNKPLQVQTSSNLDSVIGRRLWENKGASPAGGGGLSSLAEIIMRADFRSVAFFKPDVALDKEGKASLTFKLPDNLTTFQIFAVATGHGRLSGTGESEIIVTKDLLLRSSLPGYAGYGDEFMAQAIVTNRAKNDGQAEVYFKADGLELMEETNVKTIEVKAGQSQEVGFKVRAQRQPEASAEFTVSLNDEQDGVKWKLPLSPPNALTVQAAYEQIGEGQGPIKLSLPEKPDLSRGGLSLEVSPSLVGMLNLPFQWLEAYAYDCLEQSTSKAFASLVRLRLSDRLSLTPEQIKTAKTAIASHISYLERNQLGGAFPYWPNTANWENRSSWLTAYVLEFLVTAKADGFAVPENLLSAIIDYLTETINNDKLNLPAWYSAESILSLSSRIASALSLAGNNVSSHLEILYEKREELNYLSLLNLTRAVHYQPPSKTRTEQ